MPFNEKDPRILRIKTVDDMTAILLKKGRSVSEFKAGMTIKVWNKMKKGYSYKLEKSPGDGFDESFKPYVTPGEILSAGAFEGKYLNDCLLEFPAEWFWNAIQAGKLCPGAPDVSVNLLSVDSRNPLSFWIKSGWIPGGQKKGMHPELSDPQINPDERGWFQWYCRYWMGRRIPVLDQIQIKRWKAFTRHTGQIKANCEPGDLQCRPRQRQGLFQWAHNPFL
jgi:hypothetical protein